MVRVDDSVLRKYTVDQLDFLHDLVGKGEEWKASDNRKELVEIETREMALIRNIVEDIKIEVGEFTKGKSKEK
jgi:hypothetical protein